jgi:hypothetical protein
VPFPCIENVDGDPVCSFRPLSSLSLRNFTTSSGTHWITSNVDPASLVSAPLTMHRVSALLPSWDRSSRQATPTPAPRPPSHATSPPPKSPGALNKVFGWAEKIVVPVTATRNTDGSTPNTAAPGLPPARYGRETYWPTSLDKECDKAARIIKSFCCTLRILSRGDERADRGDQLTASSRRSLSKRSGQSRPIRRSRPRRLGRSRRPRRQY